MQLLYSVIIILLATSTKVTTQSTSVTEVTSTISTPTETSITITEVSTATPISTETTSITTEASTATPVTTETTSTTTEPSTVIPVTTETTVATTEPSTVIPVTTETTVATTEPSTATSVTTETTITTTDASTATSITTIELNTKPSTTTDAITTIIPSTTEANTIISTSLGTTFSATSHSTITTAFTTTTTTLFPLTTLLECNFSSLSCLSGGNEFVETTNGSEFAETSLLNSTEPPRAPLSDVTSISKVNGANQICQVPYNVSVFTNTSTNWDMYFCYENKCPAVSGGFMNCSSGSYALISFNSTDSSKNITLPTNGVPGIGAELREQCLHYYYYLTFNNDTLGRGQKIEVYIITSDQPSDHELIDTVTVEDMRTNGWQNRFVKINSSISNYTLMFSFNVNVSSLTNSTADKPIYFALDDIQLYDNNCSYAAEILNLGETTASPTSPTTQTTIATTTTGVPSDDGPNVPLALGLSLGLGIPVLLGLTATSVYYYRRNRRKNKYLTDDIGRDIPTTYLSEQDTDVVETTFF